jgi:N-acetylglutamate synthase-like GNAT family acetyltransferase
MTDEGRDQIRIRRARPHDQAQITAMVRRAHLNPSNLDWSRFMVAERHATIVGAGQIRVHTDGARELASLVVQDSVRGQGVASDIIDALLADNRGEMYTLIDRRFTRHFQRWGFHVVDTEQLPRSMMRTLRFGRVVTGLAAVLTGRRMRIVPLKRP